MDDEYIYIYTRMMDTYILFIPKILQEKHQNYSYLCLVHYLIFLPYTFIHFPNFYNYQIFTSVKVKDLRKFAFLTIRLSYMKRKFFQIT